MEFIPHLSKIANGVDAIYTFVDRLSRRIHFASSKSTDSALDTADSFFSKYSDNMVSQILSHPIGAHDLQTNYGNG